MPGWLTGLGLLVAVTATFAIVGNDFGKLARIFLTPDTIDAERIERKFGKDTPEALAALAKRNGPGRHWRDARTGIAGLIGMVLIVWMIFG